MKVLGKIPTPWHAYAVTFSLDGSRLAVGGGSWYGNGGVLLIRLDDGERGTLKWDGIPGVRADHAKSMTSWPSNVPTVSGICFSDDDRFLAASMWSFRQHHAPTMLFEVDGTFQYRERFNTRAAGILPNSAVRGDNRRWGSSRSPRIPCAIIGVVFSVLPAFAQQPTEADIAKAIADAKNFPAAGCTINPMYSGIDFQVWFEGPLNRVARASAEAKKKYMPFARSNVPDEMLATSVDVYAYPAAPRVTNAGVAVTPSATIWF